MLLDDAPDLAGIVVSWRSWSGQASVFQKAWLDRAQDQIVATPRVARACMHVTLGQRRTTIGLQPFTTHSTMPLSIVQLTPVCIHLSLPAMHDSRARSHVQAGHGETGASRHVGELETSSQAQKKLRRPGLSSLCAPKHSCHSRTDCSVLEQNKQCFRPAAPPSALRRRPGTARNLLAHSLKRGG